jgi:hypothetical protein
MPMYEYVLRQAGRAEETLISDVDSVGEGDQVTIRGRTWIVVDVEPTDDPQVTERKILEPPPQK